MRFFFATSLMVLLASSLGLPANAADQRPVVEVSLELTVPHMRGVFVGGQNTGPNSLPAFQERVARSIEKIFANELCFLRFSHEPQAYKLRVSIDLEIPKPTDPANNALLNLKLYSPSNSHLGDSKCVLRNADHFLDPVTPDRLQNEVIGALQNYLASNSREAIANLFSQIPLATEIYVMAATNGVVAVPFSFAQLEAEQPLGFEFETANQNGVIAQHFHHGLAALADPIPVNANLPPPYSNGLVAEESNANVRIDINNQNHPFPHTAIATIFQGNGRLRGAGLYVTAYSHVPAAGSSINGPLP